MGIRFQCQHCLHPLHLKSELAGRKGVCPKCKGKFRIPLDSVAGSLSTPSVGVAGGNTIGSAGLPNHPGASGHDSESQLSAIHTTLGNSVPAMLVGESESYWVAPPSGGRYGPADKKLLLEWANQNRITPDSLLYVVPPRALSNGLEANDQSQDSTGGIRADVLLREVFGPTVQNQTANLIDPLQLSPDIDSSLEFATGFQPTASPSRRVDAIIAAKDRRKRKRNFQIVILCGMLAIVALLCVALSTIMSRPTKVKVVATVSMSTAKAWL